MAKNSGKSKLAAKLGAKGRKAFDAHRSDDTTYSTAGELPAGIEGGVAKLVKCEFKAYVNGDNKGEMFWQARGVVLEPTEHNGEIIEGRQTSLGPWPIVDNPESKGKYNTVESQIARILNELRKLGANEDDLNIEEAEETARALVEAGVCFRFSTFMPKQDKTGQYKDVKPRLVQMWKGLCEYDGENADDVVDETSDDNNPEEPTDDAPWEADDLTAMGKAAANDDEEAQTALTEKAEAAGLDTESEDYEEWTWEQVAEAIIEKEKGGDEDEPEHETSLQDLGDQADSEEGDENAILQLTAKAEEEEIDPDYYEDWASLATALVELREGGGNDDVEEPEVDSVWNYKPKGKNKAEEMEVKKVNKEKKTVTLQALDDEKEYKGVPWSKLEQ